ncbi:MAG: hypothetical protein CMO80_01465 [Verrucomicrobiales bacterium]|nr:hypothetical protein [Verrucomicrobiales bacterium]
MNLESVNLRIEPKGEPPLFLELGARSFLFGRSDQCEISAGSDQELMEENIALGEQLSEMARSGARRPTTSGPRMTRPGAGHSTAEL